MDLPGALGDTGLLEITFTMSTQLTIVRSYKGTQTKATAEFQKDAQKMSALGYVPTTQAWAPGTYGCGSFVLAAILCFAIIGIIVFIYMLLVKPPGTLTVTYQLVNAPR